MKVVLDTNILLNFFQKRDNQSITYLNELLVILEKKEWNLILPTQVVKEFHHKKNKVVKETKILFENNLNINLIVPDIIKNDDDTKTLEKKVRELKNLKEKVIKNYEERCVNPESELNKYLSTLFEKANIVDSDRITERAYYRCILKFPPLEKNNKKDFGDAIIWESILEYCTGDDLVFISADGGFNSRDGLEEYLEYEWKEKAPDKTIQLYNNLGDFIRDNNPETEISEEMIETDKQQLHDTIDITKPIFSEDPVGAPRICDCCGDCYVPNIFNLKRGSLSSNRCPNCMSHIFGKCVNCNKCGKRYHEEKASNSGSLYNEYICEECPKGNNFGIDTSTALGDFGNSA